MKDFSCELFEIDIRVPAEQFEKDGFLEEIKDYSDTPQSGRHSFVYNSADNPDKQHAHIVADLRGQKRFGFKISYYGHPGRPQEKQSLSMEGCAQWLGQFFRTDEVRARLDAFYAFKAGKYVPAIALPFPLMSGERSLAGSQVTGVCIKLPSQSKIDRAIIQEEDNKDITIQIDARATLNLRQFDLESHLANFSPWIMTLVKPVSEA
jgi:hypothetical protein